jgi:hypothetical protein
MKKIAIIGLLAAIIIACKLLFQYHAKISKARDEAFRENLAGVWWFEIDNLPHGVYSPKSMRCTNTVAADGSYVELSWFSQSDRTNTYQRTGTWLVKNGHLIQTVKSSTNPSEKTPWTSAGRIVRADARGFTVSWQNSQETAWQKIVQRCLTAE